MRAGEINDNPQFTINASNQASSTLSDSQKLSMNTQPRQRDEGGVEEIDRGTTLVLGASSIDSLNEAKRTRRDLSPDQASHRAREGAYSQDRATSGDPNIIFMEAEFSFEGITPEGLLEKLIDQIAGARTRAAETTHAFSHAKTFTDARPIHPERKSPVEKLIEDGTKILAKSHFNDVDMKQANFIYTELLHVLAQRLPSTEELKIVKDIQQELKPRVINPHYPSTAARYKQHVEGLIQEGISLLGKCDEHLDIKKMEDLRNELMEVQKYPYRASDEDFNKTGEILSALEIRLIHSKKE